MPWDQDSKNQRQKKPKRPYRFYIQLTTGGDKDTEEHEPNLREEETEEALHERPGLLPFSRHQIVIPLLLQLRLPCHRRHLQLPPLQKGALS